MAIEHSETKSLALTKKEIVDTVGLIVAQLGDEPLSGNHSGASPVLSAKDSKTSVITRYQFIVAPNLLGDISRQFTDQYTTVLALTPLAASTLVFILTTLLVKPNGRFPVPFRFKALTGEIVEYTFNRQSD